MRSNAAEANEYSLTPGGEIAGARTIVLPVPANQPETHPIEIAPADSASAASRQRYTVAIKPSTTIRSERRPESFLKVLQEWEGYVVAVDTAREEFDARLVDLTAGEQGESESATFLVDDVGKNDLDLIRPGAIFRWLIGYRTFIYGKRERVSNIVFRRLPIWTKRDIKQAESQAQALANALRWE